MDLRQRQALPKGLREEQYPPRRRLGQALEQRPAVNAVATPRDVHGVEPRQAQLERPQGLLQGLREIAPNRHGLPDRFHRCGEGRVGAGKFLEREARHFRDDVVDDRLERGRCGAGHVVHDFIEGVTDRQPCRDLGDRKSGGLGGQRAGTRYARVHLDHDNSAVSRVDGELDVGTTGFDPDGSKNRDRSVPERLVFLVRQSEGGRNGNAVAGVDTHGIDVLDRADDDRVVRAVADHLHLELFPADHGLFDQDLRDRREVQPSLDDRTELLRRPGDAAAGAAERE